MLRCAPDEVGVCCSATHAWCMVVYGIDWAPGDVLVTGRHEYGSNFIAYLQLSRRFGIHVAVARETPAGDVDLADLARLLSEHRGKVRLVSMTHVPTSSGRVYSAGGVGEVCRAHRVTFLLDACQSAGQMPLDVAALGCDFLTATSRKYLRGPRGAGFVYASRAAMEWHEPGWLDNWGGEWTAPGAYRVREGARRYELYEMSFAAKAGLGVAARLANGALAAGSYGRVRELADELRGRLEGELGGAGVAVADRGAHLCGIVSFTVAGMQGRHDEVREFLARGGGGHPRVNVSVSRRPSTRLDYEGRGLHDVLRASLHYYNDEADLDSLVAGLRAFRGGGA